MFKEIETKETLSHTMTMGVITLLYKKKGDKKLLKNWRPISLLNVDYKIIARDMANRLKLVLPNIVSESPTCCITGGDIADTHVSVRDIIDLVEMEKVDGYIVKIDPEKAFDRVSHDHLVNVLNTFDIFYCDILSSVKCNDFLTNCFPIKTSVRHSCPISALLYVLSAEPLYHVMSCNTNIRGIKIPLSNKVALIFQHAYDTTLTLSDTNIVT